mmetsp:Transcript_122968/g.344176  ORF Transcript_122968/g.344176 Transcript_122968/m.344176 type:complete len:457 (+) Transcript_122968:276-1646(+)
MRNKTLLGPTRKGPCQDPTTRRCHERWLGDGRRRAAPAGVAGGTVRRHTPTEQHPAARSTRHAPEADSHIYLSRVLAGACRRAGPATRDLLGGRPVGGRLQVGLAGRVRLLAVRRVVQPDELLRGRDPHAHEAAHDAVQHRGDPRRVGEGGQGRGELHAEQTPAAAVEEPAVLGEEAREHRPDEAARAVAREGVERVVDEGLVQLEDGVDEDAAQRRHDDRAHRGHEARGRGDDDEAHHSASDRAHGGHVLQVGPLDERPDDEASGGRKVGVDERERGVGVRSQGGAGVEAGPTEPQHRPAQDDEGNVVRLHLRALAEAAAGAQEHGEDQRRHRRDLVHHGAPREVLGAQLRDPTSGAPDPVADRGVHEQRPQDDEDDVGAEAHPLHDGPGDDGSRDDDKGHLVGHKEEGGEARPVPDLLLQPRQTSVAEPADEAVALVEREGEADEAPRQGDDTH